MYRIQYFIASFVFMCFAGPKNNTTDLHRIRQADANALISTIPDRTESTITQPTDHIKIIEIKDQLDYLKNFFSSTFQLAQDIVSKNQRMLLVALENRTSHPHTTGAAAAASAETVSEARHVLDILLHTRPIGTTNTDHIPTNKLANLETITTTTSTPTSWTGNDERNSDIDASTTSSSDESIENRATDPIIANIVSQLQTFTDDELNTYLRIISTYIVLR